MLNSTSELQALPRCSGAAGMAAIHPTRPLAPSPPGLFECQVRIDQDRITHITAGEERLSADAYVLAAGPWTGPLSTLIGVPLPVRPGKGYSIDVPPYGLRSATNLSDAKVAVTPLSRNLRLAGTMEFGGLDEELNQIRIGAILAAPGRYFRDWTPPPPR